MADENIGRLVAKLNREIQKGVELFISYKKMSKEFQNRQIIIRNSTELLMEFDKLKKKYIKDVEAAKTEKNTTLREAGLETLKKIYDKQLKIIKEKSEESEKKLVNSEKKFLKGKENIRKLKKIILTKILDIGKEIKSKMGKDFDAFINRFQKRRYEVLDGKKISFDTLIHHLNSGEISEEVAKTTKQIDKLMTVGNIVNRKKKMEIGIKQKEIQKLLKEFDKIMETLKKIAAAKFPNKNITNDDIESLLRIKYSKENSPEFKKMISKLRSNLRTLKYDIQIKMQELKELERSS